MGVYDYNQQLEFRLQKRVSRKVEVHDPKYFNNPNVNYTRVSVKGVTRFFVPVEQIPLLLTVGDPTSHLHLLLGIMTAMLMSSTTCPIDVLFLALLVYHSINK